MKIQVLGQSAALSAAIGVILGSSAWAAETPTNGQLEEIIVTAQRTETSLQETPVSVTALSAQVLEERGIKNLLDVGNFTPNLEIGSRSGQGATAGVMAIRGIGSDGNAQPAVGLYIDEVYYPSGFGNLLNLLDVDRIEVERGPQGTLFGRNTISGALQYVTVKPSQTFGGFVEGSVGNLGSDSIRGAINIPLGPEFAVRIAVADDKDGGYVRDTLNGVNRGEVRNKQYRVQARWTPGDRFTLDLKAEGFKEETNGRAVMIAGYNDNAFLVGAVRAPLPFGGGLPNLHYTDAILSTSDWQTPGFNNPDWFHAYYNEGQATLAYKLTDTLTLKSISAYSVTRTRSVFDGDDTQLPAFTSDTGDIRTRFFTEELQIGGSSFADRLKWTVGYFHFDTKTEAPPFQLCIGVAPCGLLSPPYTTDIKSNAIYGQGTYNFTDRLSLLAGLRYSKEDTHVASGPGAPSAQSFTDTSPALGLNFKLTADAMLYVKASKGFRGGGTTSVVPDPAVSTTGFVSYGPETAWTYEAGLRWESGDKRLRVNPTVFFTDWKGIQFNSLKYFAHNNTIVTLNAGDAHVKGAELETQFAATDNLMLTGSASYLNGEYTRVDPSVSGVSTQTELQRMPKYKLAGGARYTFRLVNGSKVVPSLDYAYTASQRSAVTDADFVPLPSYGLLNGRLSYTSPSGMWNVAAYGTNLLNKFYLIGGVNYVFTAGTLPLDPGNPRRYGVTVRANF